MQIVSILSNFNTKENVAIMSGKIQRDFTHGSIGRHLIQFCLPFLLSNFIQACYSVADMLIVGNFCPTEVLSGVTNGAQITNLVINMVAGLTVGGTVLVGQYFGAKKEKDVSETIGTMFSLMALVGVVLTVIMIAITDWVMAVLNVPVEARAAAKDYTNICLLGTVFTFGYNAISAVQRGMGESKRPLYFVAIACVINVFLDLWLVAGLHMGSAGAAWATITAQAISMLLAAVYLKKKNFIFDFKMKSFRIHMDKVRLLLKLGIPSSIQSIISSFSFMLMTSIVNSFGVEASAAVGIVGRFNSFAILPAVAMSSSVSSMAAQNIGAGLYDRAKKSMKYGIGIALGLGVIVFTIAQLFCDQIMLMFMNEYNETVIAYGRQYMRAFSFDYLLVPFAFCFNGLLNGAGYTTFTLINNVFSAIAFRMPVAYFLSRTPMMLAGVGAAAPAASVAGGLVSFVYIMSGKWMKNVTGIRRDVSEKPEEKEA